MDQEHARARIASSPAQANGGTPSLIHT